MEPALSVVVLTYNEEKAIERCLSSLNGLTLPKEVLVIDSLSTDNTVALASSFPDVTIYTNPFVDFASQRNFAIEQCKAPWILMLDADERLSEALCEVITGGGLLSDAETTAYDFPRKEYHFGCWQKFGYPDYQRRLFRNNGCRYRGSVHERLDVEEDKVKRVKAPLIHEQRTSVAEIIEKMNKYTTLELERRDFNFSKPGLYLRSVCVPALVFFRAFFLRKGWRSGFVGFYHSAISAFYFMSMYYKAYEKLQTSSASSEEREVGSHGDGGQKPERVEDEVGEVRCEGNDSADVEDVLECEVGK